MPQQSFSAQVAAFADDAEKKMLAVFRAATQEVISEMQRPGWSVAGTKAAIDKGLGGKGRRKNRKQMQGPVTANGSGGNLPIDEGFLRASLVVNRNGGFPLADRDPPKEGGSHQYDENAVNMVIKGAELGDTIHAGYTAKYAPHVEYGARGRPPRRFVGLAAQRWQEIVNRVVAQLNGPAAP
ncbi:hypothetical protein ACLBXM_20105 [Xanthobacteraceae bacterium A53D]